METSVHADAESVWKYSSFGTFARQYNEIAKGVKHYLKHAPLNLFDVEKLPGLGDSHALVQKQIFESTHASLSMLIGYLEQKVGVTESEVDSLRNFIQANLRRVIFKVPEREFEVQDAIESLLVGRGMAKGLDYDRETGRVKVSVKESVPDFIFPQLSHALEVKLSKSNQRTLLMRLTLIFVLTPRDTRLFFLSSTTSAPFAMMPNSDPDSRPPAKWL